MEVKPKIEQEIRHLLDSNREFRAKELRSTFPTHGPLIAYTLKSLLKSGEILKIGSTRGAYYVLNTDKNRAALSHTGSKWERTYENADLSEADVYDDVVKALPRLGLLHENIRSIFDYGFSEMVNNAIDHSESPTIHTLVEIHDGKLRFEVHDDGIGAFVNVMRKRDLANAYEAALDVLKGKTTTVPDRHSGEGIFFTSKAGDRFVLESGELSLIVDNIVEDTFLEDAPSRKGTHVSFEIALNSNRHLDRDVFKPYSVSVEEPAFDKTQVHVKLYRYGAAQISRSQARRLLTGLEKFKVITLDFERVPAIGQGFADEVFRVFQKRHVDITLEYVNANDAVRFMIERAKNNQL